MRHTSVAGPDGACVAADEREHYDLEADPFQLENLFPAPAGSADERIQRTLATRAKRLADCSGIRGRDRAPVGRSYCE
jgi:hypothetical protein